MDNVFDTLVERGFIATEADGTPKQVTNLAIREILSKEKIRGYIGFDPTAASFHVGNLVQIMLLAHLQRAGHTPIVLVGGGTGMVGDPSGKTELRKLLTKEQIVANMESQKKQFTRYINFENEQAIMVNNADWLLDLNYIEFLRDIGRHFSVNRMLTADCIKNRLEVGLSFIEFNYMVLQSYDFLKLFQEKNCILQMGGDDQWGNICSGIDLIRRVTGKEAFGITCPLITTATGAKMGKSERGAVWLSADLVSPYEYFQYWRNVDDRDVGRFLSLFTFLPMDEVRELREYKDSKINEAKERLAFEATKITHGEESALQAQKDARKAFTENSIGEGVRSIELTLEAIRAGIRVTDIFHLAGLVPSKSEARRLVEKGGAYVNREKIDSIETLINENNIEEGTIILRSGKKNYAKVIVK